MFNLSRVEESCVLTFGLIRSGSESRNEILLETQINTSAHQSVAKTIRHNIKIASFNQR